MSELILWQKQELNKLRRDMDQLFRRFREEFGVPRSLFRVAEPISIDLTDTESALVLRAELPGVQPDDITISVTEDRLILKADIKEEIVEKGLDYHRVSKGTRSIERSISLPCRIETEDVKASYEGNILKLILPKSKPKEGRSVRIQIK